METKNESEKIFEQYLDSNGFQNKWIHEPTIEGKSKKPDYMLNWKENKCFFEVKQLEKKRNDSDVFFDIYRSLRNKIDEARKKFKEYKEYGCSLVVFNNGDSTAVLKPSIIFGAMLGNEGISADYNFDEGESVEGSEKGVFLYGGKMIDYRNKIPWNTTISAIIVLEEFQDNTELENAMQEIIKNHGRKFTGPELIKVRIEQQKDHPIRIVPRVVVIENPFAEKPFSEDLFNGGFDEHWRWRKDLNGKVERMFAGNKCN